jgi:DegV family protein with EDD domain
MGSFVIVTDSTSNLAPDLAEECDVPVIPLNVHWGSDTYLDGVTISSTTFYQWLQERRDFPKTSQPSAGEFVEFLQKAAQDYETNEILGLFISSEMSGTIASAQQAKLALAESQPTLRFEIMDSRSVSMGLGLQVLHGAKAKARGATIEETMAEVARCRDDLEVLFAVDTLEFLHRGGRIGGAARLLGSALNLKPVLTIEDGRVESLEKVRSRKKSLRRLLELIEERLDGQQATAVSILHAAAEDEVEEFAAELRSRLKPAKLHIRVLTPVVGTHGGPGTIGVAYHTLT